MSFRVYLENDLSQFSEWKRWSAPTLASYVQTQLVQYRREYGDPFKHSSAPPSRDRSKLSPQKRAALSRKIRLLRREGYPQAQAVAIAHRMLGIEKKERTKRRS